MSQVLTQSLWRPKASLFATKILSVSVRAAGAVLTTEDGDYPMDEESYLLLRPRIGWYFITNASGQESFMDGEHFEKTYERAEAQ